MGSALDFLEEAGAFFPERGEDLPFFASAFLRAASAWRRRRASSLFFQGLRLVNRPAARPGLFWPWRTARAV